MELSGDSEMSENGHGKRLVYELKDLPELLHISYPMVAKLVKAGTIRSISVGRRRLIPVAAIDEFLSGESPKKPAK